MNSNSENLPDQRSKIREQAGVLLIVLILAGSGLLIINSNQSKKDIKFIKSGTSGYSASATGNLQGQILNTDSQLSQTNNENIGVKININTASLEDLDKIPGVGPATAQKIIDYRNKNGSFKTIEEIKEVSGIGDAKYEKMKGEIAI